MRFFNRTFDDPDAYEQTIRLANASSMAISERGDFNAQLTTVDLDHVWLQSGEDNLARTMHTAFVGERCPIAFLTDPQVLPFMLSGAQFGTDDIFLYGRDSDHFQRTSGPTRWASISLPSDCFEEEVRLIADRRMGYPSIPPHSG